MSKKLVTYFSADDCTDVVAAKLAKLLGAPLFEIVPKVPYTKEDLDWKIRDSRRNREMRLEDDSPEIAKLPENLAEYDIIFIGFPIWRFAPARIIDTFVTTAPLAGKKIVLFATAAGYRMFDCLEILQFLCPSADFIDGAVLSNRTDEEFEEWANQF